MPPENAIIVRYWISSDTRSFPDLDGIDEFRRELSNSYISVVDGRRAGAGGPIQLWIELLSTISLQHLAQLILDGLAFDLVKRGAEAFVLRPFIDAYKRLKERNATRIIDIGDLHIQFQDALVVVHEIESDTLISQLDHIFKSLAHSYSHMILNDYAPFEVHIPVFEDPETQRDFKFRIIGKIDETIRAKGSEDYFRYWGLKYDLHAPRVFDVPNQLILEDGWKTLEQHWNEITKGSAGV